MRLESSWLLSVVLKHTQSSRDGGWRRSLPPPHTFFLLWRNRKLSHDKEVAAFSHVGGGSSSHAAVSSCVLLRVSHRFTHSGMWVVLHIQNKNQGGPYKLENAFWFILNSSWREEAKSKELRGITQSPAVCLMFPASRCHFEMIFFKIRRIFYIAVRVHGCFGDMLISTYFLCVFYVFEQVCIFAFIASAPLSFYSFTSCLKAQTLTHTLFSSALAKMADSVDLPT